MPRHAEGLVCIGLLQLGSRHTQNSFHDVGRNPDGELAHAQNHHLGDRRRQGQHQLETGPFVRFGLGFDATTQCIHLGTHHVHADTATGQLRDLLRRRKPRHKNQVGGIAVAERGTRFDHTIGNCLGAYTVQVQATTIVTERDRDVIALLQHVNQDVACCGLARRDTRLCRLDAVRHRIAQQMFKRGGHTVEHPPVHLDGATGDIKFDLFSRVFGGLTHHAIQAV